jgi:hypothetical protein
MRTKRSKLKAPIWSKGNVDVREPQGRRMPGDVNGYETTEEPKARQSESEGRQSKPGMPEDLSRAAGARQSMP